MSNIFQNVFILDSQDQPQSVGFVPDIDYVEVTALTCRINKNNNTYRLSDPN